MSQTLIKNLKTQLKNNHDEIWKLKVKIHKKTKINNSINTNDNSINTNDNSNKIIKYNKKIEILNNEKEELIKKLNVEKTKYRKHKISKPVQFPSLYTKISNELAIFMDVSLDTYVNKSNIIKFIMNYVKINDLWDKNNNDRFRRILPDEKLTTILNLNDDTIVSFANILQLIRHIFIKDDDNEPCAYSVSSINGSCTPFHIWRKNEM